MKTAGHSARYACLLLLALWSCGGSSDTGSNTAEGGASATAATQHIEACSLLSAQDVTDAMGMAFAKGRSEEHGGGAGEGYLSLCVFSPVDSTAIGSVTLSVRPSPDVTDPAAALEAQVKDVQANAAPDYSLDSVPELGAGAGWDATSHQLTIFRPGMMVMLTGIGRGDLRAPLVSLAQKALSALSAKS